MGLGCFRLPCWDGTGVHAIAEARDPSPDNELGESIGTGLQDSTNNHDGRANEDGLLTSEHISKPDGSDSAEEAAERVCTNWVALVMHVRIGHTKD